MTSIRRTAVVCCVMLAASAASLHAQSVIGKALDSSTNHAAEAVLIELLDSTDAVHKYILTDTAGWFRLRADRPGTYRLRGSGLGYGLVLSQPLKLEQATQIELEVTLQPEAVALDPVRVVAERNFRWGRLAEYYDRLEWTRRSGFGRVYTRMDIEQRSPIRISHLWETGLRRDCPYTYFLDGMQVALEDIDMSIRPEDVEGVEVYRSRVELPPEYVRRAQCGAVLVWLRRDAPPGRPITWRRALLTGGALVLLGLLVNAVVW